MPLSPVVLIAAAETVPGLRAEAGAEQGVFVFADTDSIHALQAITEQLPKVVVLEQAFVETQRGASLINKLKTDPALSGCQIRVLPKASDYLDLVYRPAAGRKAARSLPGQPLPSDYLGTRRARRLKMGPGVDARLDESPTTLVDLSTLGAQVVAPTVVRIDQRVHLSLGDKQEVFESAAAVVWASFELAPETSTPQYRVGMRFVDADRKKIEGFCTRHRLSQRKSRARRKRR